MFEGAIEKAEKFIRPVVVCRRYYDGSVEAEGGTIVVVNKDGWFIGTARLFEVIPLFRKHTQEAVRHTERLTKLRADTSKAGRRELKRLRPDPRWITASSIWPGADGVNVTDIGVIPEADLFLGRLDPFDPSLATHPPAFRNPAGGLKTGTPLCKVGYSYTELKTTFDPEKNKFDLNYQNLVPCPVDGMYTRDIVFKTPEERKVQIKFIETSTPGLRGQAGAPVVDAEGRVWAIHSRTTRLPLDSSPETMPETRGGEQFLNVSWAIHTEVIVEFLKERNVEFSMGE